MSSTRTQIYLTVEQRRRIDVLADAEDVSMAEVVRRAIDAYLGASDPSAVLAATFGAVTDIDPPSRDEWARG